MSLSFGKFLQMIGGDVEIHSNNLRKHFSRIQL